MKTESAIQIAVISALVLVLGCGEARDEAVDAASKRQSLVFNDLNVEQSRSAFARASGVRGARARNRVVQTALLSNAAGSIQHEAWLPERNLCERKDATGTGVLSSGTRMVTAYHVVHGSNQTSFDVILGGRTGSGDWVEDDTHPGVEENVLLANRLFQLGLRYWAANTQNGGLTRDALRSWEFQLDDRTNWPGFGPGGLDVAVLKASGLTSAPDWAVRDDPETPDEYDDAFRLTPFFTPSGRFDVGTPGVFYDQVHVKDFTSTDDDPRLNDSAVLDNRHTKLSSVYYGRWPFEGATTRVPLATDAAHTDHRNKFSPCPSANACSFVQGSGWQPTRLPFSDHCIDTTVDSQEGTSGAPLLFSPVRYWEIEHRDVRDYRLRSSYGVLAGNTDPDPPTPAGWEHVVQTSPELPTDDHATVFTATNSEVESWAGRDVTYGEGGDAFDPRPDQPLGDGTPTCTVVETPEGERCFFSSPDANDVWGTPADNAEVQAIPDDDTIHDEEPKTDESRFLCDYRTKTDMGAGFRTQAGIAVGLIGTATDAFPNADTEVSSFGVVCSPWASVDWARNWHWLYFGMRRHTKDPTGGNVFGGGTLRTRLPLMWEWRQELATESRYARPISMKTCPPNYWMRGVVMVYDDQDDRVLGVQSLLCENAAGDLRGGLTGDGTVSLNPLVGPGVPGNVWAYSANGRQFHLRQQIGNPGPNNGPNAKFEELACDDGEAVMGLQITRTEDGPAKRVFIECGDAPGSVLATQNIALSAADTHVERNQTTSFGDDTSMRVGGPHLSRSLLKLDLEAVQRIIGAGALTSVVLELPLSLDGSPTADLTTLRMHRMTQDWTEVGATWDCADQQPDGSCSSPWNVFEHPGSGNGVAHGRERNFDPNPWVESPSAHPTMDVATGSLLVDVTNDVKAMLTDGQNHGWILIADGMANEAVLKTRESGDGPEVRLSFDPVTLPDPTLELSPGDGFVGVGDQLTFVSPEPATAWFVNGIRGGGPAVGYVSATGTYTAPDTPPSLATVQVAALTSSGEVAAADVTISRSTIDPSAGEAAHTFFGVDEFDSNGRGFVAARNTVASGDLNSDGIDDIVIGAFNAASVANSRDYAGEVRVFFGHASLPQSIDMRTESPDIVIWGEGFAGGLGTSIAIGDIDGDGRDDLIVGESSAGPGGSGAVHVFFGDFNASRSIDLATEDADLTILPADVGDALGWRVSVGDVDGDGVTDLLPEARLADGPGNSRPNSGEIYVVSGGAGLRTANILDLSFQAPRATIYLPPIDETMPSGAPPTALAFARGFENIPVSVGDVTNDGLADIVVGRNSAGAQGNELVAGSVRIVFGGVLPSTIDLAGPDADAVFYGGHELDMVGVSTLVADVTGDGIPDLIAGAPGMDSSDRLNTGGAWIVPGPIAAGTFDFGAANAPAGAVRVFGPRAERLAGYSVAVAQTDNDSAVEIALSGCLLFNGGDGACGPTSERQFCGELYVFDLSSTGPVVDLHDHAMDLIVFGADPFDMLGTSVYRANTNGVLPDELVVGAPGGDGPANQRNGAGEVVVISTTP